MARQTRPPHSAASFVPAALDRLARLSGNGTAPDRMAREAERIVADWRADPDTDAQALAERLEELRENLAAGVASAEEQGHDLDAADKAAVRQAAIMLAGLRAALDAIIGV